MRIFKKNFAFLSGFLCGIVLLAGSSRAQGNLQDVVYLKNGSIIRGIIIEQVPGKSLKIETHDGSVFVYNMDEIEKMTRERPKRDLETTDDEGDEKQEHKSGYAGYATFGLNQVLSGYGASLISLHDVNGLHLSSSSTLGLGLGIEFATAVTLIPIWLDFHTSFGSSDVRPSLWGRLGFIESSGYSAATGVLIGAGSGMNVRVSKGLDLILDAGFVDYSGDVALELMFGIAF